MESHRKTGGWLASTASGMIFATIQKLYRYTAHFISTNTFTIRVSIAYYKEQDLCKAAQKICQAYAEFAHVTPDSIFLENQSTNCYYH